MNKENPYNFAHLEVSRPAVKDKALCTFRDRVRHYGNEVFGEDYSTMIVDEAHDGEDAILKGIGEPRLNVYPLKQIRLPIIVRRATPKKHYQGRYLESSTLFDFDDLDLANPPKRPDGIESKRLELITQLDRSGYRHDIMDQTKIRIECDSIQFVSDPVRDPDEGIEIALVPSAGKPVSRMLIDQAGICFRALAEHSRRSVYPDYPNPLYIPFARLPLEFTDNEQQEFMEQVKGLLPARFILGKIGASFGTGNGRGD